MTPDRLLAGKMVVQMSSNYMRLVGVLSTVLLVSSCALPWTMVSNDDPDQGPRESEMTAITGTVYNSSGHPVEGVVIQWSSNEDPPVSSHEKGSRTIDDGSYRLVLFQGSWDIYGMKDGARTGTETVVLGADDVIVDLQFPR
ncbi:hypothetical protein AB0M72_19625 [Nocardiopsis dassonvillei]